MKKLALFSLTLLLLFATACKKESITPIPTPKTLNDLKASDSFKWATSQTVEVFITGLPTVIPVKSTLAVYSQDGDVVYKINHSMSQDISFKVVVPAKNTNLRMTFGAFDMTSPISDKRAAFSFIPVDDNQ
jgi:hypothetical protein